MSVSPIPPPSHSPWSNQIPPGMGRLVVDASFPSGAFLMNGTGARVVINGVEHNVAWGPNSFDLPPGQHHVRVSSRYLGDTSPAEAWIPVVAGQESRAFYKAASTVFHAGSLGPQPQATRGQGAVWVWILVPMVLVVLAWVAILNGW